MGTTGNLTLQQYDGTQVTLLNVAAGVAHPFHAIKVVASGTTAGGLFWSM